MRRTHKNLVYHELIGLEVEVLNHPDPSVIGVKGIIVWETKRTLIVSSRGKHLVILKTGGLFRFKLPHGELVELRGDHLMGTPIERARRILRGR